MYNYLIVIEKAEHNYSAYSPDLPGCIATGKTPDEVRRNMQVAIDMHLKGMREDGLSIPEPQCEAGYVAVEME